MLISSSIGHFAREKGSMLDEKPSMLDVFGWKLDGKTLMLDAFWI